MWVMGGTLLSNSQGCVYYSYDGINLINSISGSALFATLPDDVKWNGSMWIMTGVIPTFVPQIAYSYDGINWKAAANVSSIFNLYTTKVTWGKSVWVVGGGTGGSMGYSYDGITWYRSSTGNTIFPAAVNALAYNGTIFIAGGYGSGQMAYSNDGINWIQVTSVFTTQCSCVEWNGKMWVAGGNGTNVIAYSYDGINWTPVTAANALWSNTFSIAWNGSFWIAGIAGSNPIAYSYDGINWIVNVNAPFNSYSGTVTGYYQTIYNNTQSNNFMITGTHNSAYSMYYSIDGLNWTPSISGSTVFNNNYQVLCIKYNGLIWIGTAEGGDNRLGYSYDGLTWTPSSSGNSVFSNNVRTLASNGSFWVAGGLALGYNTNSMGYSLNGINWSVSTSGSSLFGNVQVLGWGNSMWIAGGNSPNSLAYSTDGINWTVSSSGNAIFSSYYSPTAIVFGNNMWVCGGGANNVSIMTYSYDGINWFPITSVFSGFVRALGYNGIMWVANGYGLFVSAYSYDGINWTGSTSSNLVFGINATMTNLTWTGSFWITTGNAGTTLMGYSYDGINWISNPQGNSLVTGGGFIALTSKYFIPATKPLNANMHELIVLNKSAPYNERNKIYSYLSEKWNLPITNGPALNSTIWLDSNNNSSITVDGSNNILTWSDISNNRYPITINGTKPILQTVNNMKVAYFNGSNVNIGIPPFTGSNNTIYIVFSANTNTTTNSRLISFNNGTNDYSSSSFNVNSNTNNGTLQYNTTSNYYQTIPFNNNLYIYTIQTNNNNVNISINNYLVNSFTNSQNYNYITLDLGSLSGNSKNWIGYIPEFIYYNTALDTNSHTGTIKYLANKWSINLDSPLINEYIPRITSPINKYMPLTNIFQNTSYVTISDTPYKSGTVNLDINVPIQDTLSNQLTIKTTDPVYLSVIDKNTLYNIIEFVGSCSIILPILTYNNDYFAFRNSGIYNITITGPNSLSVVITPSQTVYFTNNAGSYTQSSTFAGFNCTLNQYDDNISNNFILYIGGWSKELSYITNLYIISNSVTILTSVIYYDQTYQADFTLNGLGPGSNTLTISDTPTTGNIINNTITTPVVVGNPIPVLDHYINGSTNYTITLNKWSTYFSNITTLDVWVSTSSDYSSSTYLLTTNTIQLNNNIYTATFTNTFANGLYWLTLKNGSLSINITNYIIKNSGFINSIFAGTGDGTYGYSGDGGLAINAKLDTPKNATFDSTGNMYITDSANHVIRKIDTSGIITTFAGIYNPGSLIETGNRLEITFIFVVGIKFDSVGNLYVCDNYAIRKIDISGYVTTVVGSIQTGGNTGDGGLAINATLNYAQDLVFDSHGNMFILTGYTPIIIRKVDINGIITTFATPGYTSMWQIAIDSNNNIYSPDSTACQIIKFSSTGTDSVYAGNGVSSSDVDGPAATAQFKPPWGICIDSDGNLYIGENGSSAIRLITTDLNVSTITNLNNGYITGMTIDPAKNIYAVSLQFSCIYKINRTFALNHTTHSGQYNILLNDFPESFTKNNPILHINARSNDKQIQITSINTADIVDNKITFDHSFDINDDYTLSILMGDLNIDIPNNINKLHISNTINSTIGYLNINNIYTITLSNTENYDLTTYEKSWNIYCNNLLITTTELANNQTLTFSYTPTEISDSLYFSVSTVTNKLLSKVNTPIIIINPSFTIQNNDTGYKLNLIGWNSKINNNLYIFDTNTNKLLTTVNSQNTLFNYKFPRAQNYLTISDTNDMSGLLNYIIKEPFIVNPLLIIQVNPTSNNWGYFNISKSYSFTLSSYYDDTPANYTDYYSSIDVYYTDVFITTVMVINNQINFTFTFDPTKITNKQGNFNFKNSKISTQSTEYIFFDRSSLKFTLNNNILTSNININAQLYVYANQSYLCDVTNSIVNFPNLNKGTYYLTISNIDKNNIRTINDINVDIDTPLIIKNTISNNNTIIIDDTINNTEIILPEPIVVTKSIINKNIVTFSKSIIGKLDDINIHSIDLHDNYENIQVNNSKIVINHTIDNNKIIFSYDSGFESNVIFNIINSVTFEIYESIDVTYL